MLRSLLGFDTFLKHMVYRHCPHLGSLYTNVEGKACLPQKKQSVHNLLLSTQQTYEIMMWHLFMRRVCFIILAQIRERKKESSRVSGTFKQFCLLVYCHSNGAI